mmetsp:Transcript_58448/g.153906  ORF Transcript_58448/g.153906 Transcript_58448/m.153906 type:complete len:308 (-) Transcript_58448:1468-2391(-)
MVCCSCASSSSLCEIFASASELACVQSLRLFLRDWTCRWMFAELPAFLLCLALGSYFSAMASRLWMARSISMIICSCRLLSWSRRSSMRWISFFIAEESAEPTLGSRASCISFSRVIFLSHSSTWRSASRISAVMLFFSSLTCSMFLSMSRHLPSISFSFFTKSISSIWFWFEIDAALVSFVTKPLFMRSMSKRRCFMEFSSSLISFRWPLSWPSMRTFFCSRTILRFFWSFTMLRRRSVSVEIPRSCVCFVIQSFCMSAHSFVSLVISALMPFSLASCGPATSASLPVSASSFVRFSSYSRLRRST